MLYIEKCNGILKDETEISKKFQNNKQNFVLLTMPFDVEYYESDWNKMADLIEQWECIPFYKGSEKNKFKDTYQYDDSYYKTMNLRKIGVFMSLSIKKMEPFGGFTSHLATLFRITKGKNIRLGIFGHIYKATEDLYQIKPYAVWRE
nr:hypothetical protein [uncultured Anaerostipes sp.]